MVATAVGELDGNGILESARDPDTGIIARAASSMATGRFRKVKGLLSERLYIELALGVSDQSKPSIERLVEEIVEGDDPKFAAIKPRLIERVEQERERKRKIEEDRQKRLAQEAAQRASEREEREQIVIKAVFKFQTDNPSLNPGADYRLTDKQRRLLYSKYYETFKKIIQAPGVSGVPGFKNEKNGLKRLLSSMNEHDPWKTEIAVMFKILTSEVCKFIICVMRDGRDSLKPSKAVFDYLRLVTPGNNFVADPGPSLLDGPPPPPRPAVTKDEASGYLDEYSHDTLGLFYFASGFKRIRALCSELVVDPKLLDCGPKTPEQLEREYQDEIERQELEKTNKEEARKRAERDEEARKRAEREAEERRAAAAVRAAVAEEKKRAAEAAKAAEEAEDEESDDMGPVEELEAEDEESDDMGPVEENEFGSDDERFFAGEEKKDSSDDDAEEEEEEEEDSDDDDSEMSPRTRDELERIILGRRAKHAVSSSSPV